MKLSSGIYTAIEPGAQPKIRDGGCFVGLGADPPDAGGWGFGGKACVLGAEPQALENFAFFCKNNFILGLF